MFLIVAPDGDSYKAKTVKGVIGFLYECGIDGVETQEISKITGSFDYMEYGGYVISKEDGRALKDVEQVFNEP